MAKFVSVFISGAHRRLIAGIVWGFCFLGLISLIGAYALNRTANAMQLEVQATTEAFTRLRENVTSTLLRMHQDLTAEPCSPAFNDQIRRIAYLPDGLNEFLYAPGGRVHCSGSVTRFDPPVDLGAPDTSRMAGMDSRFWFDHDLSFLGLDGMRGTIVLSEPFAAIVPLQAPDLRVPEWLGVEAVLVADGQWWHRSGEDGIYAYQLKHAGLNGAQLVGADLHQTFCDDAGMHCLATRADLGAILWNERIRVAIGLVVACLLATFATVLANTFITRYWSFEARFRRNFDGGSFVCAYQPVMELESGEITGCEVLARWRDVDDRIVFPDSFIGIVERHGMTLRFTEMIVQRAFEELSGQVPEGKRLQVNFNIFPRDLDSRKLAQVFAGFIAQPERFDIVLEIIESDEIPPNAQREIEALRRLGIKTYIDDFGTGYSNMQNLAALSVDGVKLDRAFAMAPDNSVMAQMLRHAVDMIQSTGRVMVVEGVETAERLALLRQMQARIDFVQGYFISRPLDIAGFVSFLSPQPISLLERKNKLGIGVVAA